MRRRNGHPEATGERNPPLYAHSKVPAKAGRTIPFTAIATTLPKEGVDTFLPKTAAFLAGYPKLEAKFKAVGPDPEVFALAKKFAKLSLEPVVTGRKPRSQRLITQPSIGKRRRLSF